MELTVGDIVEGKVKSIRDFGAFITLPGGKTGMVHISDVANTFVSNIRDHLTEGQDVKVMVTGIEGNKINLSIKRLTAPAPGGAPRRPAAPRPARPATPPPAPKTADQLFEEKLKQFMTESDSKISSIRQYSDRRTRSRRR